jgi:hypothetical protein
LENYERGHVSEESVMNSLEEAMNRLEKRFEGHARAMAMTRSTIPDSASASPSRAGSGLQPANGSRPPAGVEKVYPNLFNHDSGKHRTYLKGVPVIVQGIGRITYRGQELRADDRAVWRQLLERARRKPREPWIDFSVRSMLRAMGWGGSSHDRARLRECLERMQATVLRIPGKISETTVQVSLIDKCEWLPSASGKTGRWRVWIEPQLRALECGVLAVASGADRPIAALAERLRRLFGAYTRPYPRKIDTLWRQCAPEIRVPEDFREQLQLSLEKLKNDGFLDCYEIDDGDLVSVVKSERM